MKSSKKRSKGTIEGTRFVCRSCKAVFVAGSRGMAALTERVTNHFQETGHMSIPPTNPKPGMVYMDLMGNCIGRPYQKDDDVDGWVSDIIEAGAHCPAWDLAKKG